MNFQAAGKVCYSQRLLRKDAKSTADPFETQQAMGFALAIPEGLP
jgi:hypothetical protein